MFRKTFRKARRVKGAKHSPILNKAPHFSLAPPMLAGISFVLLGGVRINTCSRVGDPERFSKNCMLCHFRGPYFIETPEAGFLTTTSEELPKIGSFNTIKMESPKKRNLLSEHENFNNVNRFFPNLQEK